ncbi:hypothetical protein SLE2022_305080 [Rubroshorea leprosula]
MEAQLTKLGGSLSVPCVQELAKKPLVELPPRYIRTDEDPPFVADTLSLPHVPVIDLKKLPSEDVEMERFHTACKDWGFFQLVNHGVCNELVEKVKLEIKEFFDLPMEEKKKFWQHPGELEGFGQAFVVSEGQKLNWGDMFYVISLPTHLRKPYLFPKFPAPLRETLEAYSAELKNLAMKMLYLMAKISEVEGLQTKKDGKWIPLKPLPNAFVINIGDIFEIVSNGIYRSIEHRATVNSEKEGFLSPHSTALNLMEIWVRHPALSHLKLQHSSEE